MAITVRPRQTRRQQAHPYPLLASVRARIVASYIVVFLVAGISAALAVQEVLVLRLEDRIADALEQEVLEFRRLLAVGRDPETGQPLASELPSAFDLYLARNVPNDDEALVTFVGDRHQRSLLSSYPLPEIPPLTLPGWAAFSRDAHGLGPGASGRFETALGSSYYRAVPVSGTNGAYGLFVVASLPHGEQREVRELQTIGLFVILGVLLAGTVVAWLAAGRALVPLQRLTETARSISESQLTRRVTVRGGGEGAEMARSFNSMLDRLERLFENQRNFMRNASHELRAPLTVTLGHLTVFPHLNPVEKGEALDLVTDELERMARIVEDLRLLAEAEHVDFLRVAEVRLGRFTDEMLAKISALAPRRWELDARADGTMMGDRERLTQAVMNLAQNAVRHTRANDTVAIGTAARGDAVSIWVRDTGPGVDERDRQRIFQRFVRGRGAQKRYPGSGLGLATACAIAEAHGGGIRLDSRPGAGAIFTIEVPFAAAGQVRAA